METCKTEDLNGLGPLESAMLIFSSMVETPVAALVRASLFRSIWAIFAFVCFALPQPISIVNGQTKQSETGPESQISSTKIELVVLGIAQDAGFPQAACSKDCCKLAWQDKSLRRNVCSLGLIDHSTGKRYLFDCTPDFRDQLRMLDEKLPPTQENNPILDGIFLTHAHIGHYAGLVHLGREVIGAKEVPTYVMPRMANFLQTNGPWSQLVKLDNILLKQLGEADPQTKKINLNTIRLSERLSVEPFVVPHRDEFSETVGFKIKGPMKTVIFLPDIDKWSKWNQSIEKYIEESDVSYLDGSFFENGEIPGRDMALIPHPFVSESIKRFAPLDERERKKVRFIHFNHTNPVLQKDSKSAQDVKRAGMAIAAQGEVIEI